MVLGKEGRSRFRLNTNSISYLLISSGSLPLKVKKDLKLAGAPKVIHLSTLLKLRKGFFFPLACLLSISKTFLVQSWKSLKLKRSPFFTRVSDHPARESIVEISCSSISYSFPISFSFLSLFLGYSIGT